MHIIHTWIHLNVYGGFKCIANGCSAKVSYDEFYAYPHLKFFKTSYPYWYDIPCDELWNKKCKDPSYLQL